MRVLPLPDPGIPDTRSPARFIAWLAHGQRRTLAAGVFFGVLWMLAQAVAPLFVGRALDSGVAHGHVHAVVGWTLALAGLGVVQAAAGIGRHRCAVTNWLTAALSDVALVALGVDARESSSGVNVNPPLRYLSGGAFVTKELRLDNWSRPV